MIRLLPLLALVGCVSTVPRIVRGDEWEMRMCGNAAYMGHVIETCDLRLPWYGPPQWVNCRTSVTDPLGFRSTTYEETAP